eukprot:TRINITY_DN27551_c0_g1_i1.p1 TRINITY_DN27551_c0_g1~~TRINITY_DN27551_c0_g1_i1.p1  ORF type:complete len:505 (-),score=93.19 TRINITY_DN27551_c0_g1_i1:172-1623(-)
MVLLLPFISLPLVASQTVANTTGERSAFESADDFHASVDLGHLLSDKLQDQLAHVMGKYGHPEHQDLEVEALFQSLLPHSLANLDDEVEGSDFSLVGRDFESLFETDVLPRARNKSVGASGKAIGNRNGAKYLAGNSTPLHSDSVQTTQLPPQSVDEGQHHTQLDKMRGDHEEMMRKHAEFNKAAKRRHNEMMERNARRNVHMEAILKQVHSAIEQDTRVFQDTPFWDTFLHNTSVRQQWKELSFDHVRPALEAAALNANHRVLVIEPNLELGIANRLVEGIRGSGTSDAVGRAYHGGMLSQPEGELPFAPFDVVLELGLVDAMAMEGNSAGTSRIAELRRASEVLSGLLKPGGSWLSVSVVPPALRTPLLERLGSAAFGLPPSQNEASQPAAMKISLGSPRPEVTKPKEKRLRGASGTSAEQEQRIASILLYGDADAHAFVYHRLRREQDDDATGRLVDDDSAESDLHNIIAAQRPVTREDL